MKTTLLFPLLMSASVYTAPALALFGSKAEPPPDLKANTSTVLNYVDSRLAGFARPPMRADLGEHEIAGETVAIDQAIHAIVKTVIARAYSGETKGISKGDHGKTHACLNGTMTVMDNVPAELQKGVIVPGAVYPLESRLSNAEPPTRSDASSTSQGVALKLKNISRVIGAKNRLPDFPTSDEQDFLMTSATTFFLSNIVEYNAAFQFRAEGGIGNLVKAILANPGAGIARLGVEGMAKLRSSGVLSLGKPESLLSHGYWSKHPYAWGEQGEKSVAVKYSVAPAPCGVNNPLTRKSKADNYQQDMIREAFAKNQEICFYFRVQQRPVNATEKSFPIEDAYIEWNEKEAPFVNVAKISFKSYENEGWDSAEKQAACNQTEFTPWNGLTAHQPLSNLARGRRFVYKASALVRDAMRDLDLKVPQLDGPAATKTN